VDVGSETAVVGGTVEGTVEVVGAVVVDVVDGVDAVARAPLPLTSRVASTSFTRFTVRSRLRNEPITT